MTKSLPATQQHSPHAIHALRTLCTCQQRTATRCLNPKPGATAHLRLRGAQGGGGHAVRGGGRRHAPRQRLGAPRAVQQQPRHRRAQRACKSKSCSTCVSQMSLMYYIAAGIAIAAWLRLQHTARSREAMKLPLGSAVALWLVLQTAERRHRAPTSAHHRGGCDGQRRVQASGDGQRQRRRDRPWHHRPRHLCTWPR